VLRSLLLLLLCILQMLPWIGELLMTQGDKSASIWWIGALFSAGAILMITRWANAKGLASVRLDLSGWQKRTVLYAFLIGLVSYGAVFLIRLAIGGLEVVGMLPLSRWWIALAGSLLTTFYIAFTEEIIFRGFVFSNLRRRYSTAVAVTGSLFLFVLFHLPKWEALMTSPYLFHLIASGLVFTIAYVKSNTLWHSIGLHWGWNMGAFALMEYKETVVWTQRHTPFGWFDLSGWISILINGILIFVIINLYKSRKLSFTTLNR
jgi:membrane protease YdiL (CAAX protease family)